MATPVLHIGPRSILPPALQPGPMPPARIKPASPRVAATPSAACAYQPGRLPNAWRFLTIYSLVRRVIMSEAAKIERASSRERVGQYVSISVDAEELKKKNKKTR